MRLCKRELRDVWRKEKNKMVLKSTFGKFQKTSIGTRKKKGKNSKGILAAGATAIIGLALFSTIASSLNR